MHCIGLGVQVGDDGARRNGEAVAGKNPYSAKGSSTPMKPGEQACYLWNKKCAKYYYFRAECTSKRSGQEGKNPEVGTEHE